MANDLNQRFTIERYATRAEVAKAIGTNLIEPFWKDIAEFRKRMSVELPIYDTAHINFSLTYVDAVQGKSAKLNDQVTSFISHIAKIKNGGMSEVTYKREMLKVALMSIAQHNNKNVGEVAITNIIEDKCNDLAYADLINYKRALLELPNSKFAPINEEFLAKFYAILRGEVELTSFYRVFDKETSSSRLLVNKEYDEGIPARLIEEMMNATFNYITNASVSLACRLSVTFFMFNYIKPFEKFNTEMAAIVAKRILAETEIDSNAVYIPLELIATNKEFFGEISSESKKTHDFTYAYLRGTEIFNELFGFTLDKIIQLHSRSLDVEAHIGDDPVKVKEEFGVEIEEVRPVVKKEQNITKKEIQARIERYVVEPSKEISEKELKKRAKDMLESDPFLKKGQADFYVHHCTPGKYYTIQQYIKFEGCVYETGRTSMDNLAQRGYYKREQIKNKFVYTPLDKE